MNTSNDKLRTELNRKFQPPIDVLLDPSLLVANRTLEQLADSNIFVSQKQATLGRTPTEPRLGDLYVPATFRELVSTRKQTAAQKTEVWEFYRGQAKTAFENDVVDLLDENNVNGYSAEKRSDDIHWSNTMIDPDQQDQLLSILAEELSFLQSNGLVLSRTPAAFDIFRDAGVPTIALGKAEIAPMLQGTLSEIGYKNPGDICVFGVSTASSTVDALTGDILTQHSDFLLYQLGD